jgi:predicted peptidase
VKNRLPLLLSLTPPLLGAVSSLAAEAPSARDLTTPEVFKAASGETLNYRLYLPPPPTDKKLPVVLFLHGAGERGADNALQLKHGIASLIRYGKEAGDPAILLIPQCPAGGSWVDAIWDAPAHTMKERPADALRLALALLRDTLATLPADPARVYVTGISMGGYGTWDAIQRTPGLFAAALPICGGGDTAMAPAVKRVPVWTFHGDKDAAVPVSRSRDMVKALEACGGNIQYREYPGAGHDVWTQTYNDTAVLAWFFAQRLAAPR